MRRLIRLLRWNQDMLVDTFPSQHKHDPDMTHSSNEVSLGGAMCLSTSSDHKILCRISRLKL